MKHLESYKIFESIDELEHYNPSKSSQFRAEIKDLLANIIDDGFDVNVICVGNDGYFSIKKPLNPNFEMFNISDVREDVVRLIDFMSDRYDFHIQVDSNKLIDLSFFLSEFEVGRIVSIVTLHLCKKY